MSTIAISTTKRSSAKKQSLAEKTREKECNAAELDKALRQSIQDYKDGNVYQLNPDDLEGSLRQLLKKDE